MAVARLVAEHRLRAFGFGRWTTIGLVGVVLSLLYLFFSLRLDWRYDLWLAVKFLPFALWTGFVVDRRPTALPYMMVLHALIDVTLLDLSGLRLDLCEALGWEVDVATPGSLHPGLRGRILPEVVSIL